MQALVVEPNVAIQALLVELLRARRHQVAVAEDLESAWTEHRDRPASLVVVDWSDPRVDGPELCRRVRSAPGGEAPFVLALVEGGQADCLLSVLERGASDFLTDPRHVASLRARLTIAERQVDAIEQRRRADAELERRALHDALTDLPNRGLLFERVQQTIVAARRHSTHLGLLLLDLDRFKEVNDTLGHQAGDDLLKQMSQRIQASLRESDTVARLGGDEFAILLPETDADGAGLAAQKVLQALDPPFPVEGQDLLVRASIGVAVYPEHGDEAETLLRHADVAMYDAKRIGGRFAIYEPGSDNHSPSRLMRTDELRLAIEREQFLLHYLPKISLRSGRVTGLEALVRWEHPERGLLLPGEFIPLAEETGLIGPLSRWVINAALRQAQVWRRTGVRLPIEVNLSIRNLLDPQFPDAVAQLLAVWGAAPTALRLELAEPAASEQLERASHTLGRLRTLGISVGIDDFGTGGTSEETIQRFEFDELKVDRSLVSTMLADESHLERVRWAIERGHNLGLPVVAEGVADAATRDRLAAYGCDQAQGYYLARPMPAVELLNWLHQGRSPLREAASDMRAIAPLPAPVGEMPPQTGFAAPVGEVAV